MNKTTTETKRPSIAAAKLCAGVMPIVAALNTVTASLMPKPAGVIAMRIDNEPIDARKVLSRTKP